MMAAYCSYCGISATEGTHAACAVHLELEPPRFCSACSRRMKVQVVPRGWNAVCVEHGVLWS